MFITHTESHSHSNGFEHEHEHRHVHAEDARNRHTHAHNLTNPLRDDRPAADPDAGAKLNAYIDHTHPHPTKHIYADA